MLEFCPQLRRRPAHNVDKFRGQLERRLLKAQILWRDIQDEAKIDVD